MEKSDIKIRFAAKNDVPFILNLIKEIASYEKLADQVVANEDKINLAVFGEKPSCEVLIASLNGEDMGFAIFFHNYSSFLCKPGLYLEDVFVMPKARGFGLGKALLVELAKIAVERKCERFEWVVLNWNTKAINFYKNLGAKPMDDWTLFRLEGEKIKQLSDT